MNEKHIRIDLQPLYPLSTGMQAQGRLKGRLDCLLCDIYGTLLISGSGDIFLLPEKIKPDERLAQLLKNYRIRHNPEQLQQLLISAVTKQHAQAKRKGIRFPEIRIEHIWQELLQFETIDQAQRFAIDFELIMNPVWPMPYLTDLLNACKSSGTILGIISNAQFFTPLIFQHFLKDSWTETGFAPELTILSYQHARAKPSQELFQLARDNLIKMGIKPSRTAYIGNDMRNDIGPSNCAGFQTILFAGDRRSLRLRDKDPMVQNVKPDLIVTRLDQVIPYLGVNTK
ncbi:MAG: HAD family hydrolase [Desulfobacteraceae bacterium]|nr:HAD family hydrolase [Desulfobacteraceae bacterium]